MGEFFQNSTQTGGTILYNVQNIQYMHIHADTHALSYNTNSLEKTSSVTQECSMNNSGLFCQKWTALLFIYTSYCCTFHQRSGKKNNIYIRAETVLIIHQLFQSFFNKKCQTFTGFCFSLSYILIYLKVHYATFLQAYKQTKTQSS